MGEIYLGWDTSIPEVEFFGLSFLFEPVAVAADVDDGGPVKQAVQRGGGHDRVAGEDLAPVGEGLVAGQDDGLLLFVAFADGLEEQANVGLFKREIADFIDDQQLGPGEVLDLAGESVLGHCFGHAAGQVDGGGEVDAVSHVRSEHAESDSQMRLAHAGRTEQHHVTTLVEEAASSQLIDDAPVERRLLVELEVGKMFLIGKIAELQVEPHGLLVAEAHLGVEQILETFPSSFFRLAYGAARATGPELEPGPETASEIAAETNPEEE